MRMILFFDLPTITSSNKRDYRKFHAFLIKEGFIMLQYSVYIKLAINKSVTKQVVSRLEKNKPADGSIILMEITEKQFNDMTWLIGKRSDNVLDTTTKTVFYDEE